MTGGVPVGRILGIEVRVHLGWVVVLALVGVLSLDRMRAADPAMSEAVGWALAFAVAGGFFASALVHDLAHAVVARRRGVPVPMVSVSFFGGTTPDDPAAPDPADDLAIVAAGPVVSLLLAAALAVLASLLGVVPDAAATDAGALLWVLAALNLVLGAANLVPAYPLDGGRIVRAIAWRRSGSALRGSVVASTAGRLTGFLALGLGVAVVAAAGDLTNGGMIALSGWFLILTARAIGDRARAEELIGGLVVRDAMEADPLEIGPHLTLDTISGRLIDPEDATTAVGVVADGAPVGVLGYRALQRLKVDAWPKTRVADVMATPPRAPFLAPEDGLAPAVALLSRAGVDGLGVVDGGRLVGMLTRRSVGRIVAERRSLTTAPRAPRLPDR